MSVSRLFHWNRKNIMKKKPTSRVYKNITEIFYFCLCSCLWKTLNMYGANTERLAYKYIHCWCSFLLLFFSCWSVKNMLLYENFMRSIINSYTEKAVFPFQFLCSTQIHCILDFIPTTTTALGHAEKHKFTLLEFE